MISQFIEKIFRSRNRNYFIVDDPVYGFAFRKNVSAKDLPFPVFDKFVFKPGAGRITDLEENKKARVDFKINSRGYRGPEFETKKNPDTIRIFASGGSTTACVSVDEEETWPAFLERDLAGRGYKVEVINAGVGAWYSYQELVRFKNEIVNFEPDIVILHQGWNEEFLYSMSDLGKSWRAGMLPDFQKIRFKSKMRSNNPERWGCLQTKPYIEHWFDNLMEFATMSRQQDIKLFTVNAPGLCDFEDFTEDRKTYVQNSPGLNYAFADYLAVSKKRIQKTLLQASKIIPCIDVEKEMRGMRGSERLKYFSDYMHLLPHGNEFLARMVADYLIRSQAFSKSGTNLTHDEKSAQQIKNSVDTNYSYIDDFIERQKNRFHYGESKDGDLLELPMERYTTF